ncbi:hypothetical protein FIU94_09470 [Sulfitobacter sp. THAF37]|uniref:hypothetical protein n=1 Tax=Sulfitobacter sp. THAF37 TaxID=2587855 RepID=UPI001268C607|nr:hypothetical protein [Sulfitobacter sp. THAF37]QFT59053.1 hypothetical protein FIU94_09470 [Sulfitobacter sp. THAF37]
MPWSPLALALALKYEHIFQPLQYFEPGIVIADVQVPSLNEACVWLDEYVRGKPECGAVIIDVGLFEAGLMVSVFPDIPEADWRMSDIRQKSVIII